MILATCDSPHTYWHSQGLLCELYCKVENRKGHYPSILCMCTVRWEWDLKPKLYQSSHWKHWFPLWHEPSYLFLIYIQQIIQLLLYLYAVQSDTLTPIFQVSIQLCYRSQILTHATIQGPYLNWFYPTGRIVAR